MIEVETRNTVEPMVLAQLALSVTGIRGLGESRLLTDSGRKDRIGPRGVLQFDPRLEVEYLGRLPVEVRQPVLAVEVGKTVEEIMLGQSSKVYDFEDGEIRDPVSGERLEDVTDRGGVVSESLGVRRVEELLVAGNRIVVSFSPENQEDLGYPKSAVDFWMSSDDGKTVKWLRVWVKQGFEELNEVYKRVAGEKVDDKLVMLRQPVATDLGVAGVLSLLVQEEGCRSIKSEEIAQLVGGVIEGMIREHGRLITDEPEVLLRIFSAAKTEAEKLVVMRSVQGVMVGDVERSVGSMPINLYLRAPMEVRQFKGGGCAAMGIEGKFLPSGTGWVIVTDAAGKVKVEIGSTLGLKKCDQCGCYYSGSSCPLCR